ncbi:MAG: PqqD family protein [Clostridiales bacterium]|nr:PqqD family protein [Clostridiales bacterium]
MKLKKGVTARKEGEQMVLVVAPQSSKSTEALRAEHVNGHARKMTYHIAGETTQTKGESDKMERRFLDEWKSSVVPQAEAPVCVIDASCSNPTSVADSYGAQYLKGAMRQQNNPTEHISNASCTKLPTLRINGTGHFLYMLLQQDTTALDLATALTDAYDVDFATARNNVNQFLAVLFHGGLLETDEPSFEIYTSSAFSSPPALHTCLDPVDSVNHRGFASQTNLQ